MSANIKKHKTFSEKMRGYKSEKHSRLTIKLMTDGNQFQWRGNDGINYSPPFPTQQQAQSHREKYGLIPDALNEYEIKPLPKFL